MDVERNPLKGYLLLIGGLGLAGLGQFYFFFLRGYVWDGVIFWGLALLCFARLIRRPGESSEDETAAPNLGRRLRTLVVGLALLLNLVAARSANGPTPPADYTPSVLLWLLSLILFIAAFAGIPDLGSWPSRLKHCFSRFTFYALRITHYVLRSAHRTELFLVLAFLLTGLLLRAWDLGHIPANLGGDEGTQGLAAVDVLEGRLRNPFATGWFTVPTMSFFAQAASLRLFGDSVAGLRALSALVGSATLLFVYLLVRRAFGRTVAVFSLAALAFNHYHIHFSRLGSNQIADPLFMALTLYFLTTGLERTKNTHHASRNTLWFLAAGLTLGLSWYGYFGSRVIMLVVVAYLGWRALAEPDFVRRTWKPLLLMGTVALLVLSPLLCHYLEHPENLGARFNQVNYFAWRKIDRVAQPERSEWNRLSQQVWRSVSAFNHTLDPTFWYRADIPYLDFVSGLLFLLGLALALALALWRHWALRWLGLWFGLALLLGWVLTENPPSSMRMVIITPAVAILVGLGLDGLLRLGRWALGGGRADWLAVGALLLGLIAFLNVRYYFFDYTPRRIYGNPSAEAATELGRYLAGREDQPFVYFYGPPFMYYDFGTLRFVARDVPGLSLPPAGEEELDLELQAPGPTLFVFVPERIDELAAVQARFPGGQSHDLFSPVDDRLLFTLYEVGP